MSSLNKNTFFKSLMIYFPTLILFLSVLNEIDLNYLSMNNSSKNFISLWFIKVNFYEEFNSLFLKLFRDAF